MRCAWLEVIQMKYFVVCIVAALTSCSAGFWTEVHTLRCNSDRSCRERADAECGSRAHVIRIENPSGENEEALLGDGVSAGGALLGSLISDAIDAATVGYLEITFSCPSGRAE